MDSLDALFLIHCISEQPLVWNNVVEQAFLDDLADQLHEGNTAVLTPTTRVRLCEHARLVGICWVDG